MSKSSSCVLKSLDNPLLNGLTLGLNIQDDLLQLQPQMFPCCSGQGFAWHEKLQGLSHCELKQRLSMVQSLCELYRIRWPQQPRGLFSVSPNWVAQTLQELASTLRRDSPPAALQFSPQRGQASNLWAKALALRWRFGVEARILDLQKSDNSSLHQFTAEASGPLALLVEQIDKLWDPMYVEALEYIIQRAYNAEAFLWLDIVHHNHDQAEAAESKPDFSLKASFAKKIAKLKSQNPLELLSPDGQSRLRSMLGGAWPQPGGVSRHA